MAKAVLEFEKPIYDLEQKIEEMRKYSDSLDIDDEIKTLEEKIKNGESFSAALATFPKVFPPVFVAMTSAGEESGKLPAALQTVGEQMAKSYELRRKVKGAMIYPAIIIVVIIIIAILINLFQHF